MPEVYVFCRHNHCFLFQGPPGSQGPRGERGPKGKPVSWQWSSLFANCTVYCISPSTLSSLDAAKSQWHHSFLISIKRDIEFRSCGNCVSILIQRKASHANNYLTSSQITQMIFICPLGDQIKIKQNLRKHNEYLMLFSEVVNHDLTMPRMHC